MSIKAEYCTNNRANITQYSVGSSIRRFHRAGDAESWHKNIAVACVDHPQKHCAPCRANGVAGLIYLGLHLAGVIQTTELQQETTVSQSVYNQIGGGVQAFNDWMAKYFSFAFAKNTFGLASFIIIFFGVIALLDKYLIMPMMKKRG